jgi:hypothetical protein
MFSGISIVVFSITITLSFVTALALSYVEQGINALIKIISNLFKKDKQKEEINTQNTNLEQIEILEETKEN